MDIGRHFYELTPNTGFWFDSNAVHSSLSTTYSTLAEMSQRIARASSRPLLETSIANSVRRVAFRMPPTNYSGRKDFLPVEPQGGLSFLFRLSEPRFA